jgi:inward rectifier potassium channel
VKRRASDGMPEMTQVGQRRRFFHDAYAYLLRASWSVVLGLFVVVYVVLNALFGTAYYLAGDAIVGARPGSWLDTFYFSAQTLSTIGYGQMAPQGIGHVLVVTQAALGMLVTALITGVVFAKFSRPTARVMFSRRMVIHERNGVMTLLFRIANARGNEIIEAAVSCTALMSDVSAEGERMRVLHDLKLRRDTNPIFALSWLVMHSIDEDSPLYGKSMEDLVNGDVRVLVSFTGIDNTLSQTVHAHYMYFAEDIDFNHRFIDVISRPEEGGILLDLDRFHDTEPIPAPAVKVAPVEAKVADAGG